MWYISLFMISSYISSSYSHWFLETIAKVSRSSFRKVSTWSSAIDSSISIFASTLLFALASSFASSPPPSVSWVLHRLMPKSLEQVWRDPYVFFVRHCRATLNHFHLKVVRIGFDLRFLAATFRLLGLTHFNAQVSGSSVEEVSPWSSSTLVVLFTNTSFTLSFVVHRQPYKPRTRCLPRSCKLRLCLPLRHPMFRAIMSQILLPPLKSLSSHQFYPWSSLFRKTRRWLASHPLPDMLYFDLHIGHIIHPQSLGGDFHLVYRLPQLWLCFRLPFNVDLRLDVHHRTLPH